MNTEELWRIRERGRRGEHIDLHSAYLEAVDLHGACLEGADLQDAYLWGANLQYANLEGANLQYADLRHADLAGARLVCAELHGADLRRADLLCADMRGANLQDADLRGADLWGANLRGARVNWESRELVAELLRSAAGDDIEKLKVAGLVLVRCDWCWREFLALDDPLKEWALRELARWVQPGDDAPSVLREYAVAGRDERPEERTDAGH